MCEKLLTRPKHDLYASRIITEITPIQQYVPSFKPIRFCAYVRVSTSHDDQLMSLRSQTEYYQQKLACLPNNVLVDVFSDAGISGAKENRPGFMAMLAKAKAGEVDLIYRSFIEASTLENYSISPRLARSSVE